MMNKRSFQLLVITLFITVTIFAGKLNATEIRNFNEWLAEFRAQAEKDGISKPTLDAALRGVKPIPAVLKLDMKQPEKIKNFIQYKKGVLTSDKIQKGRANIVNNEDMLTEIGKKYGVPKRFIVALWGVETHYGAVTGKFSIIGALATLAYDGRRSDFFRSELMNALRIIDMKQVSVAEMKGSWAGAMGQTQFMPSSYLTFAVDYNEDGRKDIWRTMPDVFASIANYLHKSGWKTNEGWGMKVKIPENIDASLFDMNIRKGMREWKNIGIKTADGKDLPDNELRASLINLEADKKIKSEGQYYLVFDNFRTLLKWNRSLYFATAVGLLSDKFINTP